mgnify:CR=1 FL=1
MRQLQRIKEDNSFCSDQLDKGMYLLYSKENRNLYFLPFFVELNNTNLSKSSLFSTSRKLLMNIQAYCISRSFVYFIWRVLSILWKLALTSWTYSTVCPRSLIRLYTASTLWNRTRLLGRTLCMYVFFGAVSFMSKKSSPILVTYYIYVMRQDFLDIQ